MELTEISASEFTCFFWIAQELVTNDPTISQIVDSVGNLVSYRAKFSCRNKPYC